MQHLNKILSETHAMPRIPRISDDNHTSTNETALHQLKTTVLLVHQVSFVNSQE